jgi:hypothetical protein
MTRRACDTADSAGTIGRLASCRTCAARSHGWFRSASGSSDEDEESVEDPADKDDDDEETNDVGAADSEDNDDDVDVADADTAPDGVVDPGAAADDGAEANSEAARVSVPVPACANGGIPPPSPPVGGMRPSRRPRAPAIILAAVDSASAPQLLPRVPSPPLPRAAKLSSPPEKRRRPGVTAPSLTDGWSAPALLVLLPPDCE